MVEGIENCGMHASMMTPFPKRGLLILSEIVTFPPRKELTEGKMWQVESENHTHLG